MRIASRSRRWRGVLLGAALLVACLLGSASRVRAIDLDESGAFRLALRSYTAVRVGTQTIGDGELRYYFPGSGAGHIRQHRYFLQLDLEHDLLGYTREGWSPARLFGWLDPSVLKYSITYRGEREGIYDYGPSEYSHYRDKLTAFRRKVPSRARLEEALGPLADSLALNQRLENAYVNHQVSRLHRIGDSRNQLFYAYLDLEKGPFFTRVGRQVLAWGETDVFRLLDNINPLDDSFGGFFIALDERRVPLDMLRASWNLGNVGPASDAFIEGFVAQGSRISQDPGIPNGSPWRPGAMGYPNPILSTIVDVPDYMQVRGGGRAVFTAADVTWTLAQYWTYLDVPGAKLILPGCPAGAAVPCNTPSFHQPIFAVAESPRVPITGASATFPLEKFYSIVRSEAAYFQGEPMNRQGGGFAAWNVFNKDTQDAGQFTKLKRQNNTKGGLNPFVFPRFLDITRTGAVKGDILRLDTFNMSVGLDVNRFIHFLNPNQTFFITTQMFYKHVFDSPGDLALPVVWRNTGVNSNAPVVGTKGGLAVGCISKKGNVRDCPLQPRLLHLDDDRFLHTLLVSTSYAGGRIVPQMGVFYDWQGAWVAQPGVTIIRDPFRFVMDYTGVFGAPTGQFGAVLDRDNVRFQVEYVF